MYKKYRVGFICGFFDILHEGHIEILRNAKSMCDYLIVAVGTDQFMIERKKRTAILNYEQRKKIVKAIRYVDEVVPESDLDKVGAFHRYHFDVMIAGDDHIDEPIYIEAMQKLKELGVDTIFIPHRFKTSSTAIRQRIVLEFLESNNFNTSDP